MITKYFSESYPTSEALKKQYRELSKQYHPDVSDCDGTEMCEVIEEYAKLQKQFTALTVDFFASARNIKFEIDNIIGTMFADVINYVLNQNSLDIFINDFRLATLMCVCAAANSFPEGQVAVYVEDVPHSLQVFSTPGWAFIARRLPKRIGKADSIEVTPHYIFVTSGRFVTALNLASGCNPHAARLTYEGSKERLQQLLGKARPLTSTATPQKLRAKITAAALITGRHLGDSADVIADVICNGYPSGLMLKYPSRLEFAADYAAEFFKTKYKLDADAAEMLTELPAWKRGEIV